MWLFPGRRSLNVVTQPVEKRMATTMREHAANPGGAFLGAATGIRSLFAGSPDCASGRIAGERVKVCPDLNGYFEPTTQRAQRSVELSARQSHGKGMV